MSTSELIKQIEAMDTAAEEFFEVYKAVVEKYWKVDHDDYEMKSRKILQLLADRGDAEDVQNVVNLANELFKLSEYGGASHCEIEVRGKTAFFDLYQDKSHLANLAKQLRNTVMVKAREMKP